MVDTSSLGKVGDDEVPTLASKCNNVRDLVNYAILKRSSLPTGCLKLKFYNIRHTILSLPARGAFLPDNKMRFVTTSCNASEGQLDRHHIFSQHHAVLLNM